MAVKAQVSITISHLIDISSITRYYLLQSSTSAAPAKPTTNPALIGKNFFNIDDMYNSPDNSKYEIQDNMLRVYLNRASVVGCIYRVDLPTGTAYTASYNVSYGGTATGIYNTIDGSIYSGRKTRVTHSGTVSESGYVSLEFSRIGGNNDKLGWVDYSNIQVELGTSATTYQKYVTPNWQLTEPAYTSGSTNTLYFVDCTEFTNGAFKYSEVSKSSSYEAAKEAYNKATAVETRVTNTETAIEQNKEAIELRATKSELTSEIDNVQDAIDQQGVALTKTITDYVSAIQTNADSISASVEKLEAKVDDNTDDTNAVISELRQKVDLQLTEDAVNIQIDKKLQNGVTKVETSTGFKFDENGLNISKSESPTNTQITENGMTVNNTETRDSMLTADKDGVDAKNLRASTYLIVGGRSRFENLTGTNRTGCFWIGE